MSHVVLSGKSYIIKGLVVSFVDVWTNWSEEKVYSGIESSLKGVIDHSKPYPR